MILYTLRQHAKEKWNYANEGRQKANSEYHKNPKTYMKLVSKVRKLDWYYQRAEYLNALADRLKSPDYEPNYDDMLNAWIELKRLPRTLKLIHFDNRIILYLLEAERFSLSGKADWAYLDYEKAEKVGTELPNETEEH